VIPVLLEALQDNNAVVRRNAARILSRLNFSSETEQAPALREALQNVEPILVPLLRDSDAEVRWRIASFLRSAGEQINPLLLQMMETEDLAVRKHIVNLLGERRSVIPALLHLLQSENRAVCWAALAALYEHGYVPKLNLRPHSHVSLSHTLASSNSLIVYSLLRLQMRATFLHGIPIHLSEAEK
jgi:HEAT repeat protein